MYKALKYLNVNRARLKVIDQELPKLRALAKSLQNDVSLPTVRFDDDTGSIHGSRHADPTARQAAQEMPDDVRELLDDIRAMTIERHRIASWIEIAESALALLTERERLIVKLRAVEQLSWMDVADEVYDRTGHMIIEKTCRRTFARAMDKIAPFFGSIGSPADDDNKRLVVKTRKNPERMDTIRNECKQAGFAFA